MITTGGYHINSLLIKAHVVYGFEMRLLNK